MQRMYGLQRLLGQLLQLQGRAVVRVVPRMQRVRGMPGLRGMQCKLPERMLGLYFLQHKLQ
jgi:hypothetical protein